MVCLIKLQNDMNMPECLPCMGTLLLLWLSSTLFCLIALHDLFIFFFWLLLISVHKISIVFHLWISVFLLSLPLHLPVFSCLNVSLALSQYHT